ncbi:MAG: hypothetical protein HLUCCA04_01120 [Oceanicaulis sp. HLUCCA04]|nr:MAG: hypothetical protein HLUCCA04_01120 [Oceanicaulis sp. HLUCCA04]
MKYRNICTGFAVSLAILGTSAMASAQEPSEAAAERLAQFERTGETVNCVNLTRLRSIQPLDDSHFLIEMRGGDMYLNVTTGQCNRAASAGTYLQYSTPGSQFCRNQIIDVVDNGGSGMLSGSCALGEFEALTPVDHGDSPSR